MKEKEPENNQIDLPAGWTSSQTSYLLENWKTKSDPEIAHCLEKNCLEVRKARYSFGLIGKPGKKPGAPNFRRTRNENLEKIGGREWLRCAIEDKAYSYAKTARILNEKGMPISREWVRKLCQKEGIKPKKRLLLDKTIFYYQKQLRTRLKTSCSYCGKEIERPTYRVRKGQKIFFCNNTCKGRWLGENFGWGWHKRR